MSRNFSRGLRDAAVVATLATVLLSPHLNAAVSQDAIPVPAPAQAPANMPDDAAAVWLAMRVAEGPETGRPALVAALDRMGWGVKDREGNLTRAPAIAEPTGLAMRDYEIETLFWNHDEQPGVRLITYADVLSVAFPTADPEELAQWLVDSVRAGAASAEPRRRFWARFIIALGVAQSGDDLAGPGDTLVIPPDPNEMKGMMDGMMGQADDIDSEGDEASQMQKAMAMAAAMMKGMDVQAMVAASTPKPVYPHDDPVLGRRPSPKTGPTATAEERMNALNDEMQALYAKTVSANTAEAEAAQLKLAELQQKMTNLQESLNLASSRRLALENDPDFEGDEDDDAIDGSRFMAEHRSTPLSVLQLVLLNRVVVADLLGAPPPASELASGHGAPRIATASLLPLAFIRLAQAAPAGGPPTSFTGQFVSAAADMWATGWGTYTGEVLGAHMPDSKFADRTGKANAIMGWIKTIILLAQNKITLEVQNAPLVRTKRRDQAGEQRRVKCVVEIDFPKTPDSVKAMRALLNIATIDLQIPEGGPVSGAKVVWRLPEGSEGGKYATKDGGKVRAPSLAYVQFAARAEGSAASSSYVSYTNDAGEAFITVEGKPQKKTLPQNVREKKRRATVAVEVTMKVGNLMQDLNDAIGAGGIRGAPGITGVATFLSEMVQRTSLFFQAGKSFAVIDWMPPAWEGTVVITAKGSGSKTEKGQKGGPDVRYEWSLDRAMEAHVQTPEWDQEAALERGVEESNRIILEVSNDTKRYKVADFSSQTSRDVEAAFTAEGPVEIQPAGRNQLQIFSRAEPSGYGSLTAWPEIPQYHFRIEPSFYSKALIFNYERNKGRVKTENRVGPYSLMDGIYPAELTDTGTYDPATGTITGTKTVEVLGSLPHVPNFDVILEFAYTLRYNEPPPESVR
jgi:hypothetical protein